MMPRVLLLVAVFAAYADSKKSVAELKKQITTLKGEVSKLQAMKKQLDDSKAKISALKRTLATGKPEVDNGCELPPDMNWRIHQPKKLVSHLKHGIPFMYFRLGDVELSLILHENGTRKNMEGTQLDATAYSEAAKFFDFLGTAPHNVHGGLASFWVCAPTKFDGDFHSLMNAHLVKHPRFSFEFEDGFYLPLGKENMPTAGGWGIAIRDRPVVLVGPAYLNEMKGLFNHFAWVEIPPRGVSFDLVDEMYEKMLAASKQFPDENVIFITAIGIMKLKLFPMLHQALGQKDTFLDIGRQVSHYGGDRTHGNKANDDLKWPCTHSPGWIAPGICDKYMRGEL